ncbi:MAG: hypothetical protein WBB76_03760 [Gaiellaceae bacterium]
MRRILVLGSLALLVAATGQASGIRTGLHGIVMRGPISPTCVAEKPCSAPASGVTLRFSRNGAVVARARTRANGSYRVSLAPGRYSVAGGRDLQPARVKVLNGRFLRVDFSIDTGIR